eukprot:363391-Chlamydomonas_euryale.AAC.3
MDACVHGHGACSLSHSALALKKGLMLALPTHSTTLPRALRLTPAAHACQSVAAERLRAPVVAGTAHRHRHREQHRRRVGGGRRAGAAYAGGQAGRVSERRASHRVHARLRLALPACVWSEHADVDGGGVGRRGRQWSHVHRAAGECNIATSQV